jgi:hypothetical protein
MRRPTSCCRTGRRKSPSTIVEKKSSPLRHARIFRRYPRTPSGGLPSTACSRIIWKLPFGGVNGSGMGSYHGYFGFKAFSHERSVYLHQ